MNKIILALLILSISQLIYSQADNKIDANQFKSVLNMISKNYDYDSFSMNYTQTVYSDSLQKNVESQENISVLKKSKFSYQIQMRNTLIVNENGLKVMIDSSSKQIYLLTGDTLKNSMWTFEEYQFENTVFTHKKIGKENQYRLYVNNPMIEVAFVEYIIDETGKLLKEVNLQYVPANYKDLENEEEGSSIESPFVKTTFEKLNVKIDHSKFISIGSIISLDQTGKYTLTTNYQDFQLFDTRYH